MDLFNQTKYTKWYYNIIQNATLRLPQIGIYTERHHISPKSLDGSNNKNNLVNLTAREHFLCHWLLTKMTPNPKMKHAFWRMLVKGNNFQNRYTSNSKTFENLRKKFGQLNKGKPMSLESKAKLSASKKGQIPWNKGLPRSDEEKLTISLSCKAATRPARSPHKNSTKEKQSCAARKRKKITCEYCGTLSQPANYVRWHGANCKLQLAPTPLLI